MRLVVLFSLTVLGCVARVDGTGQRPVEDAPETLEPTPGEVGSPPTLKASPEVAEDAGTAVADTGTPDSGCPDPNSYLADNRCGVVTVCGRTVSRPTCAFGECVGMRGSGAIDVGSCTCRHDEPNDRLYCEHGGKAILCTTATEEPPHVGCFPGPVPGAWCCR